MSTERYTSEEVLLDRFNIAAKNLDCGVSYKGFTVGGPTTIHVELSIPQKGHTDERAIKIDYFKNPVQSKNEYVIIFNKEDFSTYSRLREKLSTNDNLNDKISNMSEERFFLLKNTDQETVDTFVGLVKDSAPQLY